jgi:hypothetical protein
MTRHLAGTVCDLHNIEAELELKSIELLGDSLFVSYHRVFDRFVFGYRERGWILYRIYPFEDLLCLPKKRALRRFRQACGLGKVEKSSGQVRARSGGGNWTGCANLAALCGLILTAALNRRSSKDSRTPLFN